MSPGVHRKLTFEIGNYKAQVFKISENEIQPKPWKSKNNFQNFRNFGFTEIRRQKWELGKGKNRVPPLPHTPCTDGILYGCYECICQRTTSIHMYSTYKNNFYLSHYAMHVLDSVI